jgi:1-acyl-sn-glycerol-3-phosphate acyltransferase
MIYRIAWLIQLIFYKTFLRCRYRGAENVPKSGPVILASNHISYLDPMVIGCGIWRPCAFMAKEQLFRHRLLGWFITKVNSFPVKRGTGDRAALKRSEEVLEKGMPLVIFPEGTRSETGDLQEPEMGVGMIAYRTGAPVVPVYVSGTNNALPKGGGLRLAPISATYGEPIRFTVPEGRKASREEYEAAARRIMAAIAKLRDEALSVER